MAENITVDSTLTKKEKYEALLPQIQALVQGETDLIANTANMVAALKEAMGFLWVGMYFVKKLSPTLSTGEGGSELVLGPFQGPVACTRIGFGKGVCGACWKQKQIIIVPDVDKFPGHIACSSHSKSEIVLPVFKNNEVQIIFDVDSEILSFFDETDRYYLQQVAMLIENML